MATRAYTEAVKRAQAKYDKANTRQIILKLNRRTDADILEALDAKENRQGYLKALIRADIAANKTPANEAANETGAGGADGGQGDDGGQE